MSALTIESHKRHLSEQHSFTCADQRAWLLHPKYIQLQRSMQDQMCASCLIKTQNLNPLMSLMTGWTSSTHSRWPSLPTMICNHRRSLGAVFLPHQIPIADMFIFFFFFLLMVVHRIKLKKADFIIQVSLPFSTNPTATSSHNCFDTTCSPTFLPSCLGSWCFFSFTDFCFSSVWNVPYA